MTRRRLPALALALGVSAALLVPGTALAAASPSSVAASTVADASPAASGATKSFTGTLYEVADEGSGWTVGERLLQVGSKGLLRVRFDESSGPIRSGATTVTVAVPAGVDASFAALKAYSEDVAPLTALSADLAGDSSLDASTAKGFINRNSDIDTAPHEVYAVLVTPNGGKKSSNQTASAVDATVQAASDYWKLQSEDRVSFELASTVKWYSSDNSCKTSSGSTKLWNEAAKKAKKQGYEPGDNVHLALFFPNNFKCGGAIGLGSVGWGVNEGGVVWVTGTSYGSSAALWEATLAHELGHNMSLGHANWLTCSSSSPDVNNPLPSESSLLNSVYSTGTYPGCTVKYYGDVMDVMGFGTGVDRIPSLSSPNAIRSGIWDDSTWTVAQSGTNDYVIDSVSSAEGVRALVVPDPTGALFFVELRDFTGTDESSEAWLTDDRNCVTSAGICVGPNPSVRILRWDPIGLQGIAGAQTYAVARSTSQIGYTVANTSSAPFYTAGGTSGSSIKVTAISGGSATIRVTLGAASTLDDWVYITPTHTHDGKLRVGDELIANIGDWWGADSYAFQWTRNGSPIVDATDSEYTLQPSDAGAVIDVKVIPTPQPTTFSPGNDSYHDAATDYWTDYYGGVGPISKGVWTTADGAGVEIDNTSTTLAANPYDWPVGTTYAYQWYRGSDKVKGATASTYTLTGKDRNEKISVKLTATPPGYGSATRRSPKTDYTLTKTSGHFAVGGFVDVPRVGDELQLDENLTWEVAGEISAASIVSFQWYRDGKKIDGATAFEYYPVAKDVGTKLRLAATFVADGAVSVTVKTAETPRVKKALAVPPSVEVDSES